MKLGNLSNKNTFTIVELPTSPGLHRIENNKHGFTIVELLVVIVVIGILAAITIVAYTGISQKAIASSLQSDLTQASKQLEMFYIDNNYYPQSISSCPPTTGNLCIKVSSNNIFSYSPGTSTDAKTYVLTATNNTTNYTITNNSNPIATAPLKPVADWLAVQRGDHYGNFYDLVTKQYATVTRTTPKTIYDPATQKIYDVPAGYLAVNPRSDGKSGYEALVEEGRTNLLTNSYNLTSWGEISGTSNDSVYGDTSSIVNVPSLSWTTVQSPYISISPNTVYTLSAYVKHNITGKAEAARVYQYDSSYTIIGTQTQGSNGISSNLSWQRVFVTLTSASNAAYIKLNFPGSQGPYTYYVNAVQLEQGAFPTSYIPTTTSPITRNADLVTVPVTNWNSYAGSFFAVAGRTPTTTGTTRYIGGRSSANDLIVIGQGTGGSPTGNLYKGVWFSGASSSTISSIGVSAFTWDSSNSTYTAYTNGVAGTSKTDAPIIDSFVNATIGGGNGGQYFNAPMQRLIVYPSALSSSNILSVTNAIKDGP